MRDKDSLEALERICISPFNPSTMPPNSVGICRADIHIIMEFARYFGVKKITEFGYGVSSSLLTAAGFDVTSYALEVSGGGKKQKVDDSKFIACNLFDPAFRSQILESCMNSDLIVVDCEHSYAAAQYYSEHFLVPAGKPVAIHDMTGPHRPNVEKEQDYLEQFVINKTFEVFAYTDMKDSFKGKLRQHLGKKYGEKRMSTLLLTPREER